MYTIHEGNPAPLPMSEQEREKVREQLNRLLETHHFRNSKRYPPLLRFIVEETLAGRGEYLKERLLGVRVFDRPADYDTAADPIVRVTIAEIRKRIAQYYHDEEHDAEMRIELLPGRYAPEFRARGSRRETLAHPPSAAEEAELSAMGVPHPEGLQARPEPEKPVKHSHKGVYLTLALCAALVAAGAIPLWSWLHPSAMDQFWAPLLASSRSIHICVPTDVGVKRTASGELDPDNQPTRPVRGQASSPSGPTFLEWEALGENVVYSDMLATLRVANVLAVHHHDYRARLVPSTTLEDLRLGPAVLIGGLDNQWTIRALSSARYRFAGSDEEGYWIADTKNPADRDWYLDLKMKWASVKRDYAIIARVRSDETGQPEIIIAGIGMSGTAAAGEFVADPKRVEELRQRVGADFKDRDFEVVLGTDVVNGIAGAPKILAVSVW